jgi:hypothetical protein
MKLELYQNADETANFNNNINEITVDKYGRIINIVNWQQ